MKRGLWIILFLVLSINFALAFSPGKINNKSLELDKDYSVGDVLRGKINLSLDDNLNILLEDNLGNKINLSDFLENNDADYECTPINCENDYEATSEATSKSFTLNSGSKKIIGINLTGESISVNSLSLDVNSDAASGCTTPLKIDFLKDGDVNWWYEESKEETCTKNYGCFNVSSSSEEVNINEERYCEKIRISEKPKLYIGAYVRKGTTEGVNLTMQLYDLNDNLLEECRVPYINAGESEVGCIVNYSVFEFEEFHVCIRANKETDYKIKTETTSPCGFYNSINYNADYYLFARGLKYKEFEKKTINNIIYEDYNSDSIALQMNDYISNKYDGDCTSGCIIPIEFISQKNQNIIVDNFLISYSTSIGAKTSNKLYDLSEKAAIVTSDYNVLDLSKANFKVGAEGNKTITISLGGQAIGSEKISVGKSIISGVYPTRVAANVRTTFIAISSGNISSYKWNFGDGSAEITSSNKITEHVYGDIGEYNLIVETTRTDGYKASKSFIINVGSPKSHINETIEDYRTRIESIKTKQNTLGWYKQDIISLIGIDEKEDTLDDIEREYKEATEDSEYIDIMGELLNLEIPKSLDKISVGSAPILVSVEDIDLEKILNISGEEQDDREEEEYQNAIWNWMNENIEGKLDFENIVLNYDSGREIIGTLFKLHFTIKNKYDDDIYIIIEAEEENTEFNANYGEEDLEGAIGIELSEPRDIEFLIKEEESAINLIYFSPVFSELIFETDINCNNNKICEAELGESWRNCRKDCKPWTWVIILIIILLIITFIVYLFLSRWYKLKYERHLFPNRNDLYNMVNFVNNALNQGLNKEQISSGLKKQGWSGEQITYVIKRIKGKKVQMPGSGIFDIFRKKEKKQPMQYRRI